MSVRLDWEIGTEHTEQRAADDPEMQRRRRVARLRLILLIVLFAAGVGGFALVIITRLNTVDTVLRQSLIQSARAEITALELGDRTAFVGLMRSNDDQWLNQQPLRFDRYQALKTQGAIQFQPDIPDSAAEVDGQRGRVLVTETVNGQVNHTVWFFWRYADGWRQAPMDVTFWGAPGKIARQNVTITYDALDEAFATALADRIDQWWVAGPQYLALTGLPPLTIQITHVLGDNPPKWDDNAPYTLIVNSPLVTGDRTTADPPIAPDLESTIASKISDKLIDQATNHLVVNANTDAGWLRSTLVDWMTALLLGRGNLQQVGFMQSLSQAYGGSQAVVAVVQHLASDSNIGVVGTAVNQPLGTLKVDWREFFQWRLGLEKTLIQSGNQTTFFALWDQSVPNVKALSQTHWTAKNQELPQVQSVTVGSDPALGTVATVQATVNGGTVALRYRFINNNWLRVA